MEAELEGLHEDGGKADAVDHRSASRQPVRAMRDCVEVCIHSRSRSHSKEEGDHQSGLKAIEIAMIQCDAVGEG